MGGRNIAVLKTRLVSLTQNAWTRLANATARKHVVVNNNSGSNLRVVGMENPWGLTFASASSQYVNLDAAGTGLLANATLLAATTGAIRGKILLNASGTGDRVIFSWSNTVGDSQIILGINAAHKLYATCIVGGVTKWTVTATTALAFSTWYDIKLLHDGVTPKLFIGALQGGVRRNMAEWPQSAAGPDLTVWFAGISSPAVASLGRRITASSGAGFFYGQMQGIRISSGMASKYNQVIIDDLLMNEGTGTSLTDQTSNGYTATFGAAGAAPTWGDFENGITLATGTNEWYDCAVTNTALWGYTTAAGTTCEVQEGR